MGEAKLKKQNGHVAPKPEPQPSQIKVGMIAIGVPSMDTLHADFAMALASLTGNYRGPHTLISAKGCYVHKGRNHIVKIAKEKGCSHLLQIDADMLFPSQLGQLPNGNPITPLHRLLAWNKDVIGCIYSRRVAPFTNLGTPKDKSITRTGNNVDLLEMDMLPTGFMLTRMEVFERIAFPWFDFKPIYDEAGNYKDEMGEDVRFCEKVREAGMTLWADIKLSMMIGHIGQAVYQVQEDSKADAEAVGSPLHRVDARAVKQPEEKIGATSTRPLQEVVGAPV